MYKYFFIGALDNLRQGNPNVLYHIFLQYLYNIHKNI